MFCIDAKWSAYPISSVPVLAFGDEQTDIGELPKIFLNTFTTNAGVFSNPFRCGTRIALNIEVNISKFFCHSITYR